MSLPLEFADTGQAPASGACKASFEAVAHALMDLRSAGSQWAAVPVRRRLRTIRALRHLIAERADALAESVTLPQRGDPAQTLGGEVLPLAEACRFLEHRAGAALRPRRIRGGRPVWLWGTKLELRREPMGVVLILGPSNYPLFLPGVEAIAALAAGNAVAVKPGAGGAAPMNILCELLREAGLPEGLFAVLDESPQAGRDAIGAGVDKVLLTGSAATGAAVLAELAPRLTPATMELSGCDAAFVLADADLDLAARALAFGMTINGGCTCIAPRRIFAVRQVSEVLTVELRTRLDQSSPVPIDPRLEPRIRELVGAAVDAGARIICGSMPEGGVMRPLLLSGAEPGMTLLKTDLFAPVASIVTVEDEQAALAAARQCPYALGATVFATPRRAKALALRINAGAVVINDMIAPLADPWMPFGGRGRSGFGVTRGIEGLLSLTNLKAVAIRGGRFRPHFEPAAADDAELFKNALNASHGRGIVARMKALCRLPASLGRWQQRRTKQAAEKEQHR